MNLKEGIERNQEGQEMDMTENNKDQTLSEEQEMDLPEEQMEEATYREKVVGQRSRSFLVK
jgi:hypothetical protein